MQHYEKCIIFGLNEYLESLKFYLVPLMEHPLILLKKQYLLFIAGLVSQATLRQPWHLWALQVNPLRLAR